MLATTGHYTKYAATALLDAPLSLFTLLSLLSTFYFLRAPKNYSRLLAMLGIFLGVAGACASKGVVGLGCVGGAVGSYVVIVFLQNRPLSDLFRAWFLGVLLLMAAFLPFLLWIIQSFRSPELWSWIGGYFEEQVLRSATTNRGETFYGEGKNYFYFLNVIVRNLWPWWWSVPLSYIAILRPGKFFWKSWVTPAGFKFYGVIAGIYFLSFFVPLSLVTYKLPHYLHPTYLLLAPVGAWSVSNLMKSFFTRSFAGFESLKNNSKLLLGFRWGALVLVGVLTLGAGVHLSSTANRGQEFYNLGLRLSGINPACSIWIPQDQTAPYRMEAFSLWYLDGRPWKRVENAYPSKIAVPPEVIYWDPSKEILWLGGSCT